jgi:hypothetical protein
MISFAKRHLRALALASIALMGIATAAIALSVPSTAVFPARLNQTQQTSYFRFTINFNDARIGSGVKFGRLPAATFITAIKCHVTAVFNAVSTNVVTVGSTPTGVDVIAVADLNEASATFQNLTTAAGLGLAATAAGEIDLYGRFSQTGTAATTGSTTCVIEYMPNNDN